MSTTKGPTNIREILESKKYAYIRLTVIAKVRVWFPVKPEFMLRIFFNRLGCLFNCGVHFHESFHLNLITALYSI